MTGLYARRFCLQRAAGVSMEFPPAQPIPGMPSSCARPSRDGCATARCERLFEVGAKAEKRMEKQYDDEIRRLTWERAVVTGKATETMPRWTHARQR